MLLTKTSRIVDITYESSPHYLKDYGYVLRTYAYFKLEDGKEVPLPINFNPSSPEQYIGKTITYSYWSSSQLRESQTTSQTSGQNATTTSEWGENNYKYICEKKYMNEGKYIIRYYTKTNPAIKSVLVSEDVYRSAREGFYLETDSFEPFLQKKK